MSDLISEIVQSRRDSKQSSKGEFEQQETGKDYWAFDNEHLSDFENFFGPVLDKSIIQLVGEYRNRNQGINVLNLQLLRELSPTKGVAVRLTDTRKDQEKKEDIDKGIYVISGDVLTRSIWKKIPANQDFIFCMPQGALYSIPIDKNIYFFLVNEAWKKLAVNGTLLIQGPNFTKKWVDEWRTHLKNQGIEIEYMLSTSRNIDYLALKMVRPSNAPTMLPPVL